MITSVIYGLSAAAHTPSPPPQWSWSMPYRSITPYSSMTRCTATAIVLPLAVLAMVVTVAPVSAQEPDIHVAYRQASYHDSYVLLQSIGYTTYRVSEGDSRAQTSGVQFNIYTHNVYLGDSISFDVVIGGTAKRGEDYSIHPSDIGQHRCPTASSTKCRFNIQGLHGDEQNNISFLIHDDDIYERSDETISITIENLSKGRIDGFSVNHIEIRDDDRSIGSLEFRTPVYGDSTEHIQNVGENVYRVNEQDQRVNNNGVTVFVCAQFRKGGTIGFDLEIGGDATIGADYSLHPRDIQPSEFQDSESTVASYVIDGESGRTECRTVTVRVRDDLVDELKHEEITFTINHWRGGHISAFRKITVEIQDNDNDSLATFHTLEGTTLPSILSEDLFDREKGPTLESFDPSKHYLIGVRNLPRKGVTSMEIRFSGTAQIGVDYLVAARKDDDAREGMVIYEPTQSNPLLRVKVWKEGRNERRFWFRIKVLDDRIEESTESIIVDINPGNLLLDGARGSKRITLRLFDNDRPAPAAEAGVTVSSAPAELSETLSSWQLRSPDNFRPKHEVTLASPSHPVILTLSFSLEGTATRCEDFVLNRNLFPGDFSGCNGEATTAKFRMEQREASYSFRIRQVDDNIFEPGGEQIVVNLGRDSQGSEVKRSIAISDNDELPLIEITSPRVVEGDAGDTTVLSYRVSKSGTTDLDVTVDYEIANTGSATSSGSDADFTHTVNSPLSFTASESTKMIEVAVSGDSLAEINETVVVRLSSPVNAGFGDTASTLDGTGTIENDDLLELSIADQEVVEGGEGETTAMTFAVTLGAETPADVTVEYEVTGGAAAGDATEDEDFTATSGTLTFSSGNSLTETFDVTVTGDTLSEPNETLTVTLSNPQCGDCPAGVTASLKSGGETATGTILDDEGVLMSISDPTVSEGNAGDSPMLNFEVTLSKVGVEEITVDYSVLSTSTAESGTDFVAVADGTLSFNHAENETSKPIPVTVTVDAIYEEDETVLVELSGLTGGAQFSASASTIVGTGTITNDDGAPLLAISSPSEEEGDADGTTVLSYEVTKSGATALPATVNYAIAASSTATATGDGADFAHTAGSPLSFTATETRKTIEVAVVGDEIAEDDETVIVTLTSPEHAGFADGDTDIEGTGTIRNDDDLPLLSLGPPPAVVEGADGDTTMLRFVVIKEGETALPATATYAISGTATSTGNDADYTHAGTSLSIPLDQDSAYIDIAVSGDDLFEPDETVIVTLSGPDNASFAAGATDLEVTGTISNDDFLHVSIEGEDVPEGGSRETATLTFTATLAARSSQSVTVDYEVITSGSGSGTAEHGAGADYTATSPTGTLTFAADTAAPQMQAFEVTVNGDEDRETDETVVARLLNLSAPAMFSEDAAATEILVTGTILNDDNPTFAVSSARVDEGGDGETANMVFEVTMIPAWSEVVTVDYELAQGTAAGAATVDEDFSDTSGTLTFNPGTGGTSGETVKSVTVEILGDYYDEADEETVTLVLSNASPNASIRTAEWTGVIVDDDAPPVFSVDSPRVYEGDTGLVDMVFTVTKTGDTRLDTMVDFAVADGTAAGGEGSADDYVPLPIGQLDFAPSDATMQITVQVAGDNLVEADETVAVTLSNPVLATIEPGGAAGTGTIANDDDFAFSINDSSAEERDDGQTSSMTFTVTLDKETPAKVTVDYDVSGGSTAGEATAGEDFAQTAGTLTFTPGGGLTQEFEVTIIGDALTEGRETLTATLSSPECVLCPAGVVPRIRTGTVSGTIIDNDALLISVTNPSVYEGNDENQATLDFEVTIDFPQDQNVMVDYRISSESTADSGIDFEVLPDGTLTFDSSLSEVSKTVEVRLIGDTDVEGSETVVIELFGVTGGAVFLGGATSTTGTGTIVNDDFAFQIEASPASITEPDTGTADLSFVVTLTPAATSEFPVRYTFGGTATEDFDFTDATRSSAPRVLTFYEGQTSRTIETLVHSDFVAEDAETVTVTLVDESGVPLGAATATATIQSPATSVGGVTIEVASAQVAQGENQGPPQVEFDLSLSATQSSEVSVDWVLSEIIVEGVVLLQDDAIARAVQFLVTIDEITSGTTTVPAGDSTATTRAALDANMDFSAIEGQLVIEMERPTGVDGVEILQATNISAPVQAAVDANGRVAAAVFDAPEPGPAPSDDDISISIEGPSSPVLEPDAGTVDLNFGVMLSGAASRDVSVTYAFGGSAVEGADFSDATASAVDNVLTIVQGNRTATIIARVNSDFVADDDETVTVTLSDANGASIASGGGTATSTIKSAASTASAVTLSVASPRIARSKGDGSPVVKFTLHISENQSNPVMVEWVLNEARDDAAHRELARGSATLPTDEITERVSESLTSGVAIQSIEGQLVLEMAAPAPPEIQIKQASNIDSNLQAAAGANNRAVVVVFSARSISKDWAITSALSGFGRSAAVSMVNTIWSRAEVHRHGSVDSHVSMGGRSVDVSAYSSGADARSAARETARLLGLETASAYSSSADWIDGEPHVSGGLEDFRQWASLPDSSRIAGESSFALALGTGPAGGSSVVYWGAGSNVSFGRELEHEDGEFSNLTTDGSTTAISLGFDYRMSESILMGLAVSGVSGTVQYSFAEPSDGSGELSPSLTTLTPWLRWQSLTGLEVWGAFGIGSGSAEATHDSETVEMDVSSQTIAAGFWNRVAFFGSVGVAAKADAFIASLSTDGAGDAVDDAGAESQRIRLAAEMTPGYSDSASRSTSYSFELGARQDGGEAESGVGVDAAGSFSYTSPGGGLHVSGRGSLIVFHGQEGFSETGLGFGLSYDPGGDARGIQLSLEPAWNAPRTNVADSMWSADFSDGLHLPSSDGATIQTRIGYGFGAIREHALAVLYGEAKTGGTARRLRLGTELRGQDGPLERLRFDFYGERKEEQSRYPEQVIMLETHARF